MSFGRVWFLFLLCGLLQTRLSIAAVFSLVAVAVNDQPFDPSGQIVVNPGDRIEVEIRVADWGNEFPDGIWRFGARMSMIADSTTGEYGTVSTGGCDVILCPFKPCRPCGPCGYAPGDWCEAGCCLRTGARAFIAGDRSDWIFNPTTAGACVRDVCGDIAFFAYADADESVMDVGEPRYAGTYHLHASDDACGTFEIGFVEEECYLTGGAPLGADHQPSTQPLLVTVVNCVPQLLSCSPPNGTIDPRIPHSPDDPGLALNTNTLLMRFNISPEGLSTSDFRVTLAGCAPSCQLVDLVPNGNNLTATLPATIPAGYWTDVRHTASGRRCQLGSLPGDIDGSGRTDATDLTILLANLQGTYYAPLPVNRCDTDRSLTCSPADLLMEADLLNGSDAFQVWNGVTIRLP